MSTPTLRKVARACAREFRHAKATFKRARKIWEVGSWERTEAYRTLVKRASAWHAMKSFLAGGR